jgi:flagellar biosynthetic protein FliR
MSDAIPLHLQMAAAAVLLALVRVTGIFLAAPFYSGTSVPPQVKVGLAFFMTACIIPLFGDQGPEALAAFVALPTLAIAVAGELLIGFAIGFAGSVALGAVQTAGYLIAQDIGLTIANVIDPITSIQTSVIGQLKLALALFIFIGLDFHHAFARVVAESFRILPLASLPGKIVGGGFERIGALAIAQGSWLFDAAVRLAIPVTVSLLLVTIAMGLLARAVPEMNVFIIGFGLRVLVGLWVLLISVPVLAEVFRALFERAVRDAAAAVRALAGAGGG